MSSSDFSELRQFISKPGILCGSCDRSRQKAISLVETLVVICVLAVIASLAIPIIANVVKSASAQTAERNLKYLNGAVLGFNQSNWELVLSPGADSSDEQKIFYSLTYRDPVKPAPGSPYLPPNIIFSVGATSDTYRAIWNGRMFEILSPGTSGIGWDLMKMMGNSTQPNTTNTPIPPA